MAEAEFVLWGCSGHAKVLAGVIARLGGKIVATFDNDPMAKPLSGIPLHIGETGFEQWVRSRDNLESVRGLVAIGGSRGIDRLRYLALMVASGLGSAPLIDPSATLDETASLGEGCQLLPGSIVSAEAELAEGCIINHKASVDHECRIGAGVHIAPGATLCSLVSVGDRAFIGTNATIPPRRKIGRGAIVGSGAVVTKDIPDYAVAVGNPARVIRIEHPEQEKE